MKKQELKRLQETVVQSLKNRYGGRLKMVVLFGSRARGEERLNSDYDLFVVIDDLPVDPVKRLKEVRITLFSILYLLPGHISFIAKTPQELNSNLSSILLDIFFDGICLFGQLYFNPYRVKAMNALKQSGLKRKKIAGSYMWIFPEIPKHSWELSWEGFYDRE